MSDQQVDIARTSGRVLGRALAMIFIVLSTLMVLELPALFGWLHWRVVFESLSEEGFDFSSAFIDDEELHFRRIPDFRWSGRPASDIERSYGLRRSLSQPITFTYDRWGYRNASEMEQADVVLIGDSYVEGWYVSDEQTVAAQLGIRLGRPVANLGVAGYGTMHELRVLEGDALRRQPRAVAWFFFEGNDLYDDHGFESFLSESSELEEPAPEPQPSARAQGWKERSFVRNAFDELRGLSRLVAPNQAPYWARLPRQGARSQLVYFFDYGAVPWTDYEEERWAKARATFESGIEFARERGIDLLFFYIPTKYRVYKDFIEIPEDSPLEDWAAWNELPALFQDFCTSASVPCVNLTDPFRQALRQGGMPYPLRDTHWSPEGHQIAAAEVEAVLRQRGW